MPTVTTGCGGGSGSGLNSLYNRGRIEGENSIESLSTRSNLPPIILQKLQAHGAGGDPNRFLAYLYILNYGWDALNSRFEVYKNFPPFVVDKGVYKDFINKDSGVLCACGLLEIAKAKCPAGMVGQLNDLGQLGLFSRLTGFQITNPATGPATHLPPSVKDQSMQANPEWANKLQSFCESIQTHAWMRCFAVGTYGSLQEAVHSITNVVQDFYDAMYALYQDMQLLAIKAQLAMAQLIKDIEYFILDTFLDDKWAFYLSLICTVLSTAQTLVDDVAFFASLFKGSDNLYNVLNAIQKVINFGAQAMIYVYNPITAGLPAAFPKQAKMILDFINNIGNLPKQYAGILLKNFNFGKMMNNKGLAIANTIIQRYGLGAQLGPLGSIMESFGCVIPGGQWHRTSAPAFKQPWDLSSLIKVPYNLRYKFDPIEYSILSKARDANGNIVAGSVSLQGLASNIWSMTSSSLLKVGVNAYGNVLGTYDDSKIAARSLWNLFGEKVIK